MYEEMLKQCGNKQKANGEDKTTMKGDKELQRKKYDKKSWKDREG